MFTHEYILALIQNNCQDEIYKKVIFKTRPGQTVVNLISFELKFPYEFNDRIRNFWNISFYYFYGRIERANTVYESRDLTYLSIFQPPRSEFFVNAEELQSLEKKITRIRDVLFESGRDYTYHPDYAISRNSFGRTDEDERKFYWIHDGVWKLNADIQPLQPEKERGGYKLLFLYLDPEVDIKVKFRFNSSFSLEIDFVDPQDPKKVTCEYHSGQSFLNPEALLNDMTDEEYKVIAFCFDQYLQQKRN